MQTTDTLRDAGIRDRETAISAAGEVRISNRALARIVGILYLVLAACSFFGVWVSARTIESDDATATADNLRSSTTLFRVALSVELVAAAAFLFTAMALYLLLAHVNRLVAAAMVTVVAISVTTMSLNLVNHYAALEVATNDSFRRTFGAAQADQLTLLFTDLKDAGFFVAQMTFGLWLLPLGYLVVRSGWFPKVLGILLMLACFSYLAEMFTHLLDVADGLSLFTGTFEAIAKMAFLVWILARGVGGPA